MKNVLPWRLYFIRLGRGTKLPDSQIIKENEENENVLNAILKELINGAG